MNQTKTHLPRAGWGGGFSLVEMMLVIAIIGLLVGLIMAAVSWSKQQSTKVAQKQFLTSINVALAAYQRSFNDVPPSDYNEFAQPPVPMGHRPLGMQPGDFSNWTGSEILCQAMVGPLKDTGTPNDGQLGYGFTPQDNQIYGPYLEMKRSENLTIYERAPNRWILLSPSTSTQHPILYYRAVPEDPMNTAVGQIGSLGSGSAIWGPSGRFDTDHNTAVIAPGEDPLAWTGVSGTKDIASLEYTMKGSRFLMLAPGPDDTWGTADDVHDASK